MLCAVGGPAGTELGTVALSPKSEKQILAKAALTAGTSLVRSTADKIAFLAKKGPLSFRVMAFLGGIAMVITSAMDIVSEFLLIHPVHTLISFYTTVLGLVIVFLEGKEWACSPWIQSSIEYYAKFLEFIWGRGVLYFFAGSLQFTRWGLANIAVGGIMCSVGITAIITGRSTELKLRKLRNSLKDKSAVEEEFRKLDTDDDEHLSSSELAILAKNLGLDLDVNEVVAATSVIGRNGSGKVSFDAFYQWWAGWDQTQISFSV